MDLVNDNVYRYARTNAFRLLFFRQEVFSHNFRHSDLIFSFLKIFYYKDWLWLKITFLMIFKFLSRFIIYLHLLKLKLEGICMQRTLIRLTGLINQSQLDVVPSFFLFIYFHLISTTSSYTFIYRVILNGSYLIHSFNSFIRYTFFGKTKKGNKYT